MNKFILIIWILIPIITLSQPINDNCNSSTLLFSNAAFVAGTMVNATTQLNEPIATTDHCGSSAFTLTVWYRFVATNSSMWVQSHLTTLSGGGGGYYPSRFTSVIYNTSNCLPTSVNRISCATMNSVGVGDGIVTNNLTGLVVGNTYLIQVGYNASNGSQIPDFNIRIGDFRSTNCNACVSICGAMCQFPFTPTVAQVVSNCQQYPYTPYIEGTESSTRCHSFVANNNFMNFSVVINSTCQSGNVSNFTWSLYSTGCGSPIQTGTLTSLTLNNLTINQTYILCYSYTVPSNCYHTIHYPYVVGTSPLPIVLISFDGIAFKDRVKLTWTTATELNTSHYEILRSVDNILTTYIGSVPSIGLSTLPMDYEFIDTKPITGTQYYYLIQYDIDGTATKYGPIMVNFNKHKQLVILKRTNFLGQEVQEDYSGLKIIYYSNGEIYKGY